MLDLVRLRIAPAVAAGATAALVAEPPLLVAGAILLVGGYAEHGLYPRHLMPLARFLLRALVPIVALLLVWAVGRALGVDLSPHTMLACAVVAWLFLALGAWARERFERDRPVRLALIGPVRARRRARRRDRGRRDPRVRAGRLDRRGRRGGRERAASARRRLDAVGAIVRAHQIDLLLHSAGELGEPVSRLEVFATVADQCLELPVRMIEFDAFYEELLGHVPIGRINSAWFQYILHPRFHPGSPLAHRLTDVVVVRRARPDRPAARRPGRPRREARRSRAGLLPPAPRRRGRARVRDREAPHDARRRPGGRAAVVERVRPARDPGRPPHARAPPGRAPAALERPARRDDLRRPAARAAGDRHRARAAPSPTTSAATW